MTLALAGCPSDPGPGAASPPPEPLSKKEEGEVRLACGACHSFPPADALPQARWAELIPTMADMPGPRQVKPEELLLAQRYYAAAAPLELPRLEQPPSDSPRAFQVEGFTPRRQEFQTTRAPATSNLRFVSLSDPKRLDLLICEMRSRALFLLPAWAPPKQRQIRGLARELNYPAHVELSDLNGDQRPDFVVASLGGMNPSDATTGGVQLLLQTPERRFQAQSAATQLGRAADARPVDLDGDGDVDLVVAAFGWRNPGKLLWLERTGGEAMSPQFTPRVLDERDGFVSAQAADLDGDGDLDLVAILAQQYEQVVWFEQVQKGRFVGKTLHVGPHPAWGTSSLELVDLDGDGDLDFLVANGDTLDDQLLKPYHGVGWLERTGEDEAGEPSFRYQRIGELYGCESAAAGDLDGDGDLDVVGASFLPQLPPSTWRGLASVVWFERTPQGWRPHALEREQNVHPALALGDYDGDGDLDLAVANYVWMTPEGKPTAQADFVTLFTNPGKQ